MYITDQHLLSPARLVASPNADERPDGEVSLIVIHCISLPAGHFGGHYVEHLFRNCLGCECHPDFASLVGLHVSSHLFVRRTGEVVQFVPFDQRAWHAGVSTYAGREVCNDFSVGIELEGTDHSRFGDRQYQVLAQVCSLLLVRYGIPAQNIVGHSDIAPGRKTDPGPLFDWPRLFQEIQLVQKLEVEKT